MEIHKGIYWKCGLILQLTIFDTGFIVFKKNSERNGCSTETLHVWLRVVKAKMCLIGSYLLKKCKQIAEKSNQIFENWKNYLLKNTFWLYQHGSNMLCFSSTSIPFWLFSNGIFCTILFTLEFCQIDIFGPRHFGHWIFLKNICVSVPLQPCFILKANI